MLMGAAGGDLREGTKMTGLYLFSGVGGMDLAFEAAGGRVISMREEEMQT